MREGIMQSGMFTRIPFIFGYLYQFFCIYFLFDDLIYFKTPIAGGPWCLNDISWNSSVASVTIAIPYYMCKKDA